jgi:hypothetical protein
MYCEIVPYFVFFVIWWLITVEFAVLKLSVIVRFEVFTAVTRKNGVFWDVTPCGSCKNRFSSYFFVACVGC